MVLAGLRFAHADSWWLVIAATALSPWLYVLAWVVAGAGALGQRWALTTVAGGLVALSLVWLVPQWYPFRRAAAPPPGAVPLRLFDANVQYTNPDLAGIAAEIGADHPDVVTLEEYSYSNEESLWSTGVVTHYRWHFLVPAGGADGVAIWSDVPMTDPEVWLAGGHPEVRAWLHPPGTPAVRLYVVHTDAPRAQQAASWHQEMSAIVAVLRAEPRPLLVAGDFNATWDMYEFRDILHLGLSDAAVEAGDGWEMTWSRQMPVLPALVRIDHVLYSPGLTVTGYRTGTGRGSDHHPVIAQLAITPTR